MTTSIRSFALTAIISLVFGFAGAAVWSFTGLGNSHTRAYLMEHPELLPEMAEAYQKKEAASRLADIADEVKKPFPGAVFGNPEGSVTLVEFTDYACGYCRMSEEHVAQLVKANPDLKVVIREYPIFQGSDKAALVALAAADQGKYAEFHRTMFTKGAPTDAAIAETAREIGLDMEKASAFAATPAAQAELANNIAMAQRLGFSGTPSWVIGDRAFEGAVGLSALQNAVNDAKGS